MIDKILDVIFPKVCVDCGKQGEGIICTSCFFNLHLINQIKKEYRKNYDYLVYLSKYKDEMRSKLLKFKFYDSAYLSEYFTELLIRSENICNFLKKFDLIIPVPMYKDKKLRRGYNQTELITKNFSNKIGIKYDMNVLKRVKSGTTQSLLNKDDRIKNVANVFDIENEWKIKDKNIILFDDIFTTGATVEVCSKIIKKAGAKKVCVLVICKD